MDSHELHSGWISMPWQQQKQVDTQHLDGSTIQGWVMDVFSMVTSFPHPRSLTWLWTQWAVAAPLVQHSRSGGSKIGVTGGWCPWCPRTADTQVSPAPRLKIKWNKCPRLLCELLFPLSSSPSLTLSLKVGVQHPKHPSSPSPQMFAGLQSVTARKASPSSSSPPCTEHSITSAGRHQTDTLTYFPTSSTALSSCEHRNKDDSSKRCYLLKNQEKWQ